MKSLVDRFWNRFEKPKNKCWNWPGSLDTSGYGLIKESHGSRGCSTIHKTHRLSWMLFNGPIPGGMCVLHKCDNRKCVNPEHLFIGTKLDNARDREKKGRHGIQKLNKQDVLEIRKRLKIAPQKH